MKDVTQNWLKTNFNGSKSSLSNSKLKNPIHSIKKAKINQISYTIKIWPILKNEKPDVQLVKNQFQ